MRKIVCDMCGYEINKKQDDYFELFFGARRGNDDGGKHEECEFCSEKCVGKWMINRANKYGVYSH